MRATYVRRGLALSVIPVSFSLFTLGAVMLEGAPARAQTCPAGPAGSTQACAQTGASVAAATTVSGTFNPAVNFGAITPGTPVVAPAGENFSVTTTSPGGVAATLTGSQMTGSGTDVIPASALSEADSGGLGGQTMTGTAQQLFNKSTPGTYAMNEQWTLNAPTTTPVDPGYAGTLAYNFIPQ